MNTGIYILVTLCVVYAKWIIILLVLPFQCANGRFQNNKKDFLLKLFAAPYIIFERHVMRGGWERYMLFQVSTIPSCHIRKQLYKALGANISPRVVFHFKTEIRSPYKLKVGGAIIAGLSLSKIHIFF